MNGWPLEVENSLNFDELDLFMQMFLLDCLPFSWTVYDTVLLKVSAYKYSSRQEIKLVPMVGYDTYNCFLWLFWLEFLVDEMGEILAEIG